MVVFGGDGKTWWSYWVFLLRAVLNGGRRSGRSHRNSTDQKLQVLFVLDENKVEQGRTMIICAHGQTGTSHNIFTCPEATRMRQSATVTGKGFNCQDSLSVSKLQSRGLRCLLLPLFGLFRLRESQRKHSSLSLRRHIVNYSYWFTLLILVLHKIYDERIDRPGVIFSDRFDHFVEFDLQLSVEEQKNPVMRPTIGHDRPFFSSTRMPLISEDDISDISHPIEKETALEQIT